MTGCSADGDALELILGKLDGVRPRGGYWMARCPAHDDGEASLSVKRGTEQPVILHCFAECERDAILDAIGLTLADISKPREQHEDDWTPFGPAVATYIYTDAAGKVLFGVCRTAGKKFPQWRPDPSRPHGRAWSVKGVKLVPYRLPRVLAAVDAGETVWIAEGEKDVHALEAAGVTATTSPMGAGKWRAAYGRHLAGAQVVIVADNDQPGITHARDVAAKLDGVAASVSIVTAAAGKDAADHLAAGLGIGDFIPLPADDALSIPSAADAHPHTPPPLAYDQDILARLLDTLRVCCGLVGEDRNAQLIYLALVTQILADPVSLALKGLSSSGKSYTLESVLRFVPDDAVIVMTAMSERALVYMKDELAHRTMVLYEAVALREEREKTESNQTAYIVRSLLSEGQIRYPVAVRGGDGNLETRWIIKEGPTNLIVTTTATSLHGENETRMLSLPTNDSEAQTRAVLRSIAMGGTGPADLGEWHALFGWLKSGAGQNVTIPYAGYLAENIPAVAVRLRRDFRSLLRLIQAHAVLHQQTRKTGPDGRIIATEADYLAVRALTADLISDAVGATVTPSMRETVEAVARLTAATATEQDPDGLPVRVQAVARHLGIERSRAQRRIQAARERGYLANLEDKRGKPGRYLTDDPMPDELVMLPLRVCGKQCPEPCTASCEGTAGQTGVYGCASTAQGIESGWPEGTMGEAAQ
jgi:Toprim-like